MRDEKITCDYCGLPVKELDGWKLVPPVSLSILNMLRRPTAHSYLDACSTCMAELEAARKAAED